MEPSANGNPTEGLVSLRDALQTRARSLQTEVMLAERAGLGAVSLYDTSVEWHTGTKSVFDSFLTRS